MRRHFRRRWSESRGDACDAWGPATYWFEVDGDLRPVRQIETYDGGQRLLYDGSYREDEFGMLTSEPLDAWGVNLDLFTITESEFESEWNRGRHT